MNDQNDMKVKAVLYFIGFMLILYLLFPKLIFVGFLSSILFLIITEYSKK